MRCKKSLKTKYVKRLGPPYPANECVLGNKRKGNDGLMYKIIKVKTKRGLINRWVKNSSSKKTKSKKPNSPSKKKYIMNANIMIILNMVIVLVMSH